MGNNYIAVLCEGKKPESRIFQNIGCLFLDATVVLICLPLGMSIYMLWDKLKSDDFETDIVELARECSDTTASLLNGMMRDNFSEIYLFMDYDPQAQNQLRNGESGNDVVLEMLNTFNNETDNGKLYISYPMIEAIRDLRKGDVCSQRCFACINKLSEYKEESAKNSDFEHPSKYNRVDWMILCSHAASKANCIVNRRYLKPTFAAFRKEIDQLRILQSQLEKYISEDKVAILSGIPLFLLDYHKEEFWCRMLTDDIAGLCCWDIECCDRRK